MKDYRILVTGSREVTKAQSVYVGNVLYAASARPLERGRRVVIVQGKCPKGGVDLVAEWFADSTQGCVDEPHPADWDRLGRAAGPRRNAEMVAAGADICLAFPAADSTGTVDCMTQAWRAGIHVRIYPLAGNG